MARTHLPIATNGADPTEEKLLQVGELAHAVGKTVRAIHHYEELGLLEPDARSKGRFRLYDQDAVTRVRWISKLHDLGLSLTQIQEVVSNWEHAPSAGRANASIREMYAAKLEETRAQIARLHELERELEVSVAYFDACEPCESTVARAHLGTCADHHHAAPSSPDGPKAPEVGECKTCGVRERDHEPELVAGLLSRSRKLHLVKAEDPKR